MVHFDPLIIQSWPNGSLKRLPKTEVNRTRTMVWYHAVRLGLKASSAYLIEKRLDPGMCRYVYSNIRRPRKWDIYEQGRIVPNGTRTERNAILQAEDAVPGRLSGSCVQFGVQWTGKISTTASSNLIC
jgi:hypothetical protein